MKKTAVVTIASENYFAQVQTLLVSLQNTNPEWDRYFCVVDEPDDDLYKALKITDTKLIRIDEIGIPDLDDMKFRYDIMEFNTAVKPFVLLTLLKEYECVVYLDPDICVYREMKEVNDAFEDGYDFVLLPHFNDYFSDDGKHPSEPDIMLAGVYNCGFFASSNREPAIRLISWWAEKLETLCVNRQSEGIFVDQKWIDLLPGRHDNVLILKHSGYNTAYWNISHRKASLVNGKYYFNGDELVFFHFSGFNPMKPNEISKHQNRFKMNEIGSAQYLFKEYAKSALENGYESWRKKPYSYNKFLDGRPVLDVFRKLYRDIPEIEEKIKSEGKNPFSCSALFYDEKEALAPKLLNYIINYKKDAGVYFINTPRNQWVQWISQVGRNEFKLNDDWIDFLTFFFSRHLMNFDKDSVNIIPYNKKFTDGVNLIGYIKSEHGVGEACRLTADALSKTDIEWSAYDWELNNPSRQNDTTWDHKITTAFNHNISIFNINADQMPVAKEYLPEEAWNGYRIGIWYWELTEFPDEWKPAFELVDEIWAPTRFIKDNLEKVSPVPVIYMPPGIAREEPKEQFGRSYFGLPEKAFLFLNFFDAFSYTSRKNPTAAVKAFQQSFLPDDMSVGLVLKVNNSLSDDKNIISLKELIGEYKNIYLVAKTMTRDEINGLINACDAAVSLHRSEGLGLLCEESMYYGKPVIATNWSGSTDFMTEDTACLVKYSMIPISEYYGSNAKGQYWADPDIDDAAGYMKKLYEDKNYYDMISQNAKKYIRTKFSPRVCGQAMQKRISYILRNKDKWIRNIAADVQAVQPEAVPAQAVQTVQPEAVPAQAASTDLTADLCNINQHWNISYYRPFVSAAPFKGFKNFIKRVVRKLMRAVMYPVIEEQNNFNASVTRILNELSERSGAVDELAKSIAYQAERLNNMGNPNNKLNDLANEILVMKKQYFNTETFSQSCYDEYMRTSAVVAEKINSVVEAQIRYQNKLNELDAECLQQRQTVTDISTEMTDMRADLTDQQTQAVQLLADTVNQNNTELSSRITEIRAALEAQQTQAVHLLADAVKQNNTDISAKIAEMQGNIAGHQVQGFKDISDGFKSMGEAQKNMSEHQVQTLASLYNAIFQRVSSIDKTLAKKESASEGITVDVIENKWKLIDKYFVEPEIMKCCICGEKIVTENAERIVSEDIYGGGTLVRYRCPGCGAIVGPNKMLKLTDQELSDEYKYHYMIHNESSNPEPEIRTFMDLEPKKGKKYLNYGCGAWADSIVKLRDMGYDVYGFDPYAPVNSEYIYSDFDELQQMQFDGIFSHDLLEHLKDPVETFRLFDRILKPDGIMAHSTACYKYVYEYDRFHLVFYTGNAVDVLCDRTNFKVIRKIEDNDSLTYNYIYAKKN